MGPHLPSERRVWTDDRAGLALRRSSYNGQRQTKRQYIRSDRYTTDGHTEADAHTIA